MHIIVSIIVIHVTYSSTSCCRRDTTSWQVCIICIIYIGVISVDYCYNCVYYCDTCIQHTCARCSGRQRGGYVPTGTTHILYINPPKCCLLLSLSYSNVVFYCLLLSFIVFYCLCWQLFVTMGGVCAHRYWSTHNILTH
jgi:hypothetical protein